MPRTQIKTYLFTSEGTMSAFKIHKGAVFLCAGLEIERTQVKLKDEGASTIPAMWFEVDLEQEVEERKFAIIAPTTHVNDFDKLTLMGSFQTVTPSGLMTCFVYEVKDRPLNLPSQEDINEAEMLGRVMAHAHHNELEKLKASSKTPREEYEEKRKL